MLEFIERHQDLLWWLAIFSVLSILVSVAAVPFVVVRLSEHYFVRRKRTDRAKVGRHPILRLTLRALKNLLGGVFIIAGVAMLLLPGQGVLTILAGLFLLDFPGKYAAERWLVRRPAVFKSINWLRTKLQVPPLVEPPPSRARRKTTDPS